MKETGARANEDGILQCKAAIGSDVTLGIFDQCIQPATILRLFYIYIYIQTKPGPARTEKSAGPDDSRLRFLGEMTYYIKIQQVFFYSDRDRVLPCCYW